MMVWPPRKPLRCRPPNGTISFAKSDQFGRGSVIEPDQRRDTGRRPMRDLGEHAVAPARLHRQRGRRGHRRRQSDQDLRRLRVGTSPRRCGLRKTRSPPLHMGDIVAGRDHARDCVGAGHERHRRQAVGHRARQHLAHVGQAPCRLRSGPPRRRARALASRPRRTADHYVRAAARLCGFEPLHVRNRGATAHQYRSVTKMRRDARGRSIACGRTQSARSYC